MPVENASKKRGRPKKNPIEGDQKPAAKRGRPRKELSEAGKPKGKQKPSKTITGMAEPGRKRGRPKKIFSEQTSNSSARQSPKLKEMAQQELVLIRNLADILNETGLTEIEFDQNGTKLRVSRTLTATTAMAMPMAAPHYQQPAPVEAGSSKTPAPAASDVEAGTLVKSPMVGTAYLAPSPGSPPFIEMGSLVKEGQTLLIIEAMKTMNQIKAPVSGKIRRLYITNGDPVEFGASLVAIDTNV